MTASVVACTFCGKGVNPWSRSTYTRVMGWERKAFGGSRKGGSDIVLRETRDEYACGGCVDKLRWGLNVAQERLA